MSSSAAAPLLNGNSVVPAEAQREADFLEQLLRIRDEVLAGKHPRIRLPPKVLEQVAPRPPQTAPSARPPNSGLNGGSYASQLFPTRSENPNEFASPVAHAQRPFSAKSTSSGIDPVLLTKSDHLIRAELQLKRQQLERALKEQLDKRGRANDEERELLDVDDLLVQAHKIVRPVSGLRAPAPDTEDGESFDENSYYSSKADSWSSEEVDRNANTQTDAAGQLTQQGKRSTNPAQLTASKPLPSAQTSPQVIELDEEPYEPADDLEIYEPEAIGVHDEPEESDYSPPPAETGPNESRRANGRYGNGNANGYGGTASVLNMFYMFPQPFAVIHPTDQGTDIYNRSSRRQSPTGPVPPIQNNRKRKRESREKRQQQASKRAVRSPEPYIKEEPQSPPPFASYTDPPSSKRRALQPLPNDVEVVSAREASRPQPIHYREQEPSVRTPRQYEEPLSPSVARFSQPQRRLERNDHDLRRVASLQNARRAYSPVDDELYAAPSPRQVRAASYAFVERPIEQHIFREASARPSAAPRYLPEQVQGHEFVGRAQSPVIMAPPPRRIVVDQYGNRYYAAPVEARDALASPSRRIEVDPYYERAVTREPTIRVPVRTEVYEDDDAQRMPPPPPRRYMEASEAEVFEARPFRREASRRPVEVEYRPHEVVERRPVPYEEMVPRQEYVPQRAYSVRPELIRREAPESFSRHGSVQPGHSRITAPRLREVSAVHRDLYEDRWYGQPASQDQRYVEEGGLSGPVEVAPERYATEAPRQISYRY